MTIEVRPMQWLFPGVLLVVIVGCQFFLAWNKRRGVRLQEEAAARGEPIKARGGLRIGLIVLSAVLFLIGGMFLLSR